MLGSEGSQLHIVKAQQYKALLILQRRKLRYEDFAANDNAHTQTCT